MTQPAYQALLFVSFGGPEGPDDVLPFLENVLRGRNVPRERMLEVAEHYQRFGGKSPINEQNRALIEALQALLESEGPKLPIYFGNRNWHPLLPDTIERMRDDGVERALAFVTSAFSSYSGCRQYRENVAAACTAVGDTAPTVDKLRVFYHHPRYIEVMAERTRDALLSVPEADRPRARILFSAHSIPTAQAAGCAYEAQLREASRLVIEALDSAAAGDSGATLDYALVYQSRSGPAAQPWLEPDVCDALETAKADGASAVVVVPIGFISDHMEVIYDLDHAARDRAAELGLPFARAATAGTHPTFVRMIRDLIVERIEAHSQRPALGCYPANPDVCAVDCCLPPAPPARPRPS
jgi:protoporphyrin/coproporphyrin ferrochelatase